MNSDYPDSVKRYYLTIRENGRNIYDIWEEGKAFKDSITPSTSSRSYRTFTTEKIESVINFDRTSSILSVGSGNAFIEHALHNKGYPVSILDINAYAVSASRKKGLTAFLGDVFEWEPPTKEFGLIYCDGVVGHLYDASLGLRHVLTRLRGWSEKRGGAILISNDESKSDQPVQPHPAVEGFHWFSEEYLRSELSAAGFRRVRTDRFFYERPVSGRTSRLLLVAET